jgi:hypothetical protein
MRTSFDKAFEIVIGLEGKPSDDPNDPGGFTIWGLSKKFNPTINTNTTIEQAKDIYLYKYWVVSGCDQAPFPLDICLFDGAVNPQNNSSLPDSGNKEIMNLNPENWQEFLIMRMQRYMRCSKDIYVKGHIFRVLRLHQQIKAITNG